MRRFQLQVAETKVFRHLKWFVCFYQAKTDNVYHAMNVCITCGLCASIEQHQCWSMASTISQSLCTYRRDVNHKNIASAWITRLLNIMCISRNRHCKMECRICQSMNLLFVACTPTDWRHLHWPTSRSISKTCALCESDVVQQQEPFVKAYIH